MYNDAMVVRIDEHGSVLVRSEKANIELWMDVWTEDGEILCDWNKYIFRTDDSDDMEEIFIKLVGGSRHE